jgi:hypothetical protein
MVETSTGVLGDVNGVVGADVGIYGPLLLPTF